MPRSYRRWLTKNSRDLIRSSYGFKDLPKAQGGTPDRSGEEEARQSKATIEQSDKAGLATKQRSKTGDGKRPPSTRGEVVIACFTVVLTIIGVGAAIATYLQWDAAKKALTFAEQSASDTGNDTQAALRVSSSIANSTAIQATAARDAVENQKEIAAANQRLAKTAEEEVQIKRATDLDIDDQAEGLGALGWHTQFLITNVTTAPIRNAKVQDFAGQAPLELLHKVWTVMNPAQTFDILPSAPHHFGLTALREPGDLGKMQRGEIVKITAIRVNFVDGNGRVQTRRGCIYYTGANEAHSCDHN